MKIYKPNTQNKIQSTWPKRVITDDGRILEGFDKAVLAGNINPNDYDWWELEQSQTPLTRIRQKASVSYVKNGDTYQEQVETSLLSDYKNILKDYIAETRYKKEIGGLDVNGVLVKTDRESQSMLIGATVMVGDEETIKWKTDSGFVELTGLQIKAVAAQVRTHVQNCFNREAELLAELEIVDPTTADAFYDKVELFWAE